MLYIPDKKYVLVLYKPDKQYVPVLCTPITTADIHMQDSRIVNLTR